MKLIAVDDEPLALKELMRAISEAMPGAELLGYSSPTKVLEGVAAEGTVDAAFLDIEMGGMDGLQLAKQLKDIQGRINIVFVTGHSQYALEAFSIFASGYLLKPVTEKDIGKAMENLRNPVSREKTGGLRVRTFGNFEVFLGNEPLGFSRSKSKELFAYLVHKRGTGCRTREIAAVLYEDQPYTHSLQKQVQTVISAMMQTLREAGAEDCILRSYNRLAIDVEEIDCDYYRFLNWDMNAVNEYMGEYMSNYSWAEFVVSYLDSKVT